MALIGRRLRAGYDGYLMRVAHFVSGFPVLSETFVRDEIEAFVEEGFENIVVTLRPRPKEADEEIQGILEILYPAPSLKDLPLSLVKSPRVSMRVAASIGSSALKHPSEFFKLLATEERIFEAWPKLAEMGVDHCHAHFAHYPATMAWGCSRMLGTTFSWNAHSYDLYRYNAHQKRRLKDSDLVFPISERNQWDLLLKAPGGAIANRVRVIRCGIDPALFPFNPKKEVCDPPLVLGVGRLVDTKGFDALIQAVAEILKNGKQIRAAIVGEGGERIALEEQIRSLGIQDSVDLLGALPRPETRRLQAEADVVVQPCRDGKTGLDGIPVVLMEAMALGTPVVSTRFASIAELVEDGVTGLLVEPGDAEGLAAAIEASLADRDGSQERAERARNRIVDEYDAKKNYREKAKMVRELIEK